MSSFKAFDDRKITIKFVFCSTGIILFCIEIIALKYFCLHHVCFRKTHVCLFQIFQQEALKNTASRRGKLTRNNSSNTTSRSGSNQSAKEMGVTAALLKEIENDEVTIILREYILVVSRYGFCLELAIIQYEMYLANLDS